MRPALVLALATALAPLPARAVDWPAVRAPAGPGSSASPAATGGGDPLAAVRWRAVPTWLAQAPPRSREVLRALDDAPGPTARWHALRAVVLRQLNHEAEARAELARALGADRGVLDDPDVALTAAYLAARARDFAAAVGLARAALARLDADTPRADLVLEVARWSMARGPDGVAPAVDLLRTYTSLVQPPPLVRATLVLALLRGGRADEARALARPLRPALQPFDGDNDNPLVAPAPLVTGEGRAAVGVALLLAGDARAAVDPLVRAAATAPPPWRAFQAAELALARSAAPGAAPP